MSAKTFTLNGWHVLVALLSFFGVVILANAIFITMAIRSFPGEQEKKSYLQGLAFNDRIAERTEQEALGWTATINSGRAEDDSADVTLVFLSASSTPISGLSVSGVLARPASDEFDTPLAFEEVEPGTYRAVAAADPGAWRLDVQATSERGERFTLEKRLTLE